MIPRIAEVTPVQSQYLAYIDALKAAGFDGELAPDYANRTVLATDNSIYQVLPQAVIFPKHTADLQLATGLASRREWQDIVLSPRGGGTGTNGQSLTDGIVVDLSRHMNHILEINAEEGWARVEAGVVKDQLNAALKEHGYFFAPELSTSNRATIGGMINTDASGQGSVMYGKTRDHVLALSTVLLDGERLDSGPLSETELDALKQAPGLTGAIHRTVDDVHQRRRDDIEARFPKLNRCLTGYDLAHIRNDAGEFDLNNILCGSEGTLGFIVEAKLNVLRIPKFSALVNVRYDSFETSLRDAQTLMQAQPTSIETVDSKVLGLAKNDISWNGVAEFFPAAEGEVVEGINLVEYTADDEAELEAGIKRLTDRLDALAGQPGQCNGYTVARGSAAVGRIWGMRKRAVGLLGNAQGEARPVPFVEDTAVPPENLADFIMDFRAVLDREGLTYGMFGHVDAGVLHVRPALDMKDEASLARVRLITDEVVKLVQKYGGLLWGEHGKGVRSEFAPSFFGDLYPELQAIKRAFDPHNQLNPGKIATADASQALTIIDAVTTRGELDRSIPVKSWQHQKEAVYCNGNGACYNYDPNDAMCPSWKGTRDRRQSPKGRASLLREWIRALGEQGVNTLDVANAQRQRSGWLSWPARLKNSWALKRGDYDFSQEVYDSMAGCLACKSCSGQCPIKVDVPEFRAKFLHLYHGRYLRPLKDYFIGTLEFVIPLLARAPFKWLYNGLMRAKPTAWLLDRGAGMVDSPLIHRHHLASLMRHLNIGWAKPKQLAALSEEERQRSVVIVQDAFTSFFDTDTVGDILKLLQQLGFRVWVMPYRANGKPLHVHGFLGAFTKVAQRRQKEFNALAEAGIPLVGVDPSMTLAYRSEYRKYLEGDLPEVLLMQEFLGQRLEQLASLRPLFRPGRVQLLGHCTEKTNAAASMADWQRVFEALGQELTLKNVGCCGMAGTYGHESRNRATSERIYDLSWRDVVANEPTEGLVATGYSCRSQVNRLQGVELRHPLQFLAGQIQAS
ncbi:FAD-linked oxidase [Saccharospirillum sp. MSK14-1]|uniref:D-2-hydroxyglutarate dehydrogenase YdiJ n=1 Tax=Saccharospirillum sp. MSK14-1 TaxID=1897632 RepID=UPI000D3BD0D3|nr:FAD-binding and (Fe-S)-binding domain-containing protein [Saccharospirillum sp. MSK14-1]PTY36906.1 FAD-linked oxidase [Saccharospirillum sp. MSK14-1]